MTTPRSAVELRTTAGSYLDIVLGSPTGAPGDSLLVTMIVLLSGSGHANGLTNLVFADSAGKFRVSIPPLQEGRYFLWLAIADAEVPTMPFATTTNRILVAAATPDATDTP